MLDLFSDFPTPEAPTLESLVQSGEVLCALSFIENLPFDLAYQAAIHAGFWVAGSKRDKSTFYEFVGRQLREACIARALPTPTPWSFGLTSDTVPDQESM